MTQSRRLPPTPDAITAALGRRLAELRKAAGIRSQAELGEKMTDRGVPWSRVSVQNLENARRGTITEQELLALPLVLDVAPITLIADPRHDAGVPVAKDLTVSPWDALMWLAGSGTIDRSERPDRDNFGRDAWLIQAGWAMVEAVSELGKVERHILQLDEDDEVRERRAQRDDDRHRQALRMLNTAAIRITHQGAPLPDFLPLDQIRRRAAELDVELTKTLREA